METGEIRCMTLGRPYVVGFNEKTRKALLFQPRCKQWSCPACAVINRSLWAMRASYGASKMIDEGKAMYFLTLTSHPKLNASQSLWVWPKGWKKLQARARYHAGGFTYFCVPEQHKNGRLHMHMIETNGLSTRWWKDNAASCGLGYMAEEDEITTPQGAANYTTKYISKQLDGIAWPRNFRRVRRSRDWPNEPQNAQINDWQYKQVVKGVSLQEIETRYTSAGFEVAVIDYEQLYENLVD